MGMTISVMTGLPALASGLSVLHGAVPFQDIVPMLISQVGTQIEDGHCVREEGSKQERGNLTSGNLEELSIARSQVHWVPRGQSFPRTGWASC